MDNQKIKRIKLNYKKKLNCPILWIVHYFDNDVYELEDFYLACVISDMIEEELKKNNVYILKGIFGLDSYKDLFKDSNFDKLSYNLILENQDNIKEKLDNIQILKLTENNDSVLVNNVFNFYKGLDPPKNININKKSSVFINYIYNVLNKIYLLDDTWNKFIIKFTNYLENKDIEFSNNDLKYIYNILYNHVGKEFIILYSDESNELIKQIINYLFYCILYNENYNNIIYHIKLLIKKPINEAIFKIKELINNLKNKKNNFIFKIENVDDNLRILFLYFYLHFKLILNEENIDLEYLLSYRTDWGHFGYLSHQLFIENISDKIPNKNEKILIISDSTIGYQQYDEKEQSLKNVFNNSFIKSKCGACYSENDALELLPDNLNKYETVLSIIGCNDLHMMIDIFKSKYNNINKLSYDEIIQKTNNLPEYLELCTSINIFWNKII
jgi:hypothetical protein